MPSAHSQGACHANRHLDRTDEVLDVTPVLLHARDGVGIEQLALRWLLDVLDLPRAERLPHIQQLADTMLARIADVIPVTPVPLAAAALMSFGETVVTRSALLDRIERFRAYLIERDAKLVEADRDAEAILERAWRTFRMRRLVLREGETYVILPSQRPLLEYYANSIGHLLPRASDPRAEMHPARDTDVGLPSLKRRDGG